MDARKSPSDVQSSTPPEAPAIKMSIQWQSENALTDTLVNYLTTHPFDCRVLFYSEVKKRMSPADDNPSGKDKGDIYGVIFRLILRITSKQVLADLPWYLDLNSIWHSNPFMAAKTHSSKPGVDHADALYSHVQSHGRAAHIPPPAHILPLMHILPPIHILPPMHILLALMLRVRTVDPKLIHGYSNMLPSPFPLPNNSPLPQTYLPGLCNSPDVDIHDNFGAAEDDDLYTSPDPFSAPLETN
ncbi:hypothetical protein P692DRAFT_20881278 [Suillus brevipes Sb2]|nr:hypothetical protein P692DRAFT_20881278 [Suillus brevipes Sb2]